MTHVQPFAPSSPEVRVLWNKIRRARKDHILKCGCILKAGLHYHCVGAMVNNRFTITKQHVHSCLELLH